MENTRPLHTHTYLAGCTVLPKQVVSVHSVGCGKHQYCVVDDKECPHFFCFKIEDGVPKVLCDHREPQTQGIVKSTSFGSIEVD